MWSSYTGGQYLLQSYLHNAVVLIIEKVTPVAPLTPLRLRLAIIAGQALEWLQIDIKSAFLMVSWRKIFIPSSNKGS